MTWGIGSATVVLWSLVLDRCRRPHRSRAEQVMTALMIALAVGLSLRVPWVWDEALAHLGGPGAVTVRCLVSVAVETLILVFIREISGRGPRMLTLLGFGAGVSVAVLAAGWQVPLPATVTSEADLARLLVSSPPLITQSMIHMVYAMWTCTVGVVFCLRYSRRAGAGPVGWGVLLIGVATAVALAGYLVQTVVTASAAFGRPIPEDSWPDTTETLLIMAFLVTLVSGLTVMTATTWWSRWASSRGHHQDLVTLEPLWHRLTSAIPNITLDRRALVSLMGSRLSPRDALYRRVIEIHDGLLALVPYTCEGQWHQEYTAARSQGHSPEAASRAADATALCAALAAYQEHRHAPQQCLRLVNQQLLDLPAEATRLGHLSAELVRRQPRVPATQA